MGSFRLLLRRGLPIGIAAAVLLIIGGSVIQALRNVREAAERTQCANNVKTIVLSVQGYHDWKKVFPMGAVANTTLPLEKRCSWQHAISPMMQSYMDDRYRFESDKAWDDPENAFAIDILKLAYQCPSRLDTASIHTNFVGLAGVGDNAANLPLNDPAVGFFGFSRTITIQDVRDGLSGTAIVAETMRDNGPWPQGGWATVRGLLPDDLPYIGMDRQFAAAHGSINVGLGDASVRLLSADTSPRVFESLATIAGNAAPTASGSE